MWYTWRYTANVVTRICFVLYLFLNLLSLLIQPHIIAQLTIGWTLQKCTHLFFKMFDDYALHHK
jgi:hypothetical protein